MEVKDIIRTRREELGLTLLDIAKKVGVSEGTVSRWESGNISNMRRNNIAALSRALQISPSVIMEWEEDKITDLLPNARKITHKRFPILGNVACGEPIYANEEHDAFIDTNEDVDADFCLTATGDSMIGARIFDGDILFVKKQEMVNDGEIAVVIIEDEATVKRVYYDRDNNVLTLVPENPTHKIMRFSGEKLNQINIIGKVIMGQYPAK